MSQKQPTPPPPPPPSLEETESKPSNVSNKDLVNMAFRVLPAYFGLCLGYLAADWGEESSGGGLWYTLAVITGLIALVSCVAFRIAGQRAYAKWMLTAEEAQQIQATKYWLKILSSTRLFILLGLLLGLILGFLGIHDFLRSLS